MPTNAEWQEIIWLPGVGMRGKYPPPVQTVADSLTKGGLAGHTLQLPGGG